jgi:hypothetical protein
VVCQIRTQCLLRCSVDTLGTETICSTVDGVCIVLAVIKLKNLTSRWSFTTVSCQTNLAVRLLPRVLLLLLLVMLGWVVGDCGVCPLFHSPLALPLVCIVKQRNAKKREVFSIEPVKKPAKLLSTGICIQIQSGSRTDDDDESRCHNPFIRHRTYEPPLQVSHLHEHSKAPTQTLLLKLIVYN